MMSVTDNTAYDLKKFKHDYPKLTEKLVNKTLNDLENETGLFVFPSTMDGSDDLDDQQMLLERVNKQVKTSNLIGFVASGDEQLKIYSRFTNNEDDYFLTYMLQKVLKLNVVTLDSQLNLENQLYDLLVYIFPRYLEAAMRKGTFKEYQKREYNDANLKGPLNIQAHIKLNSPFMGKIAYKTREFTYDNAVMQLIRHTVEEIKTRYSFGCELLQQTNEITRATDAVMKATETFDYSARRKIIIANEATPVRHAYYTEYRMLQQLCLLILKRNQHGLNGSNQPIHGVIFDVAWLWEEYLNTLLAPEFIHPQNKLKQGGISLFSNRQRTVYPDFYSQDKSLILDAKYKRMELTEKGIGRSDLYQIISYAYVMKAKSAGIIYPSTQDDDLPLKSVGTLDGYGANIFKYGFTIPQNVTSYVEFINLIEVTEKTFKQNFI